MSFLLDKERKVVCSSMIAAVLSGCAMMSSDSRIDAMIQPEGHVNADGAPDGWRSNQEPVCNTFAGSYSLPKTYVRVTIERRDKKRNPVTGVEDPKTTDKDERYEIQDIELIRREDPRHTYCLEYNASPTSDDVIQVKKAAVLQEAQIAGRAVLKGPGADIKQTNLLASVATDGIDRSRVIIQDLVQTIFTGLAQRGRDRTRGSFQLRDGKKDIAAQLEFDPLDPVATARANRTFSEYGFCVVLGGYSFNWETADINWYCKDPIKFSKDEHQPAVGGRTFAQMMAAYDQRVRPIRHDGRTGWRVHGTNSLGKGVLYRPTMSYPLYVFGRVNPKVNKWNLHVKREVELENISPIVAVDIERPFFNQRKTQLNFHGGVLTNVCVFKTSELREIVEIPFVIVNAISDLPTKIVQLRFSDVDSDRQLAAAENKLLKAQLDYLKELQTPTAQPAPGAVETPALTQPSDNGEAFALRKSIDNFPNPQDGDRSNNDRCKITTIADAGKKQ